MGTPPVPALRLKALLEALQKAAHAAAWDSDNLGTIIGKILFIDIGKAREAAADLKALEYVGAGTRLTEDTAYLLEKADEYSRGPYREDMTANDQRQEQRALHSLQRKTSDLASFLNELIELASALANDTNPTAHDSSMGWLSATDLANKYGVNADNLRHRLGRWRRQNDAGWMEVPSSERRQNEPQFLFREDAVADVILEK